MNESSNIDSSGLVVSDLFKTCIPMYLHPTPFNIYFHVHFENKLERVKKCFISLKIVTLHAHDKSPFPLETQYVKRLKNTD